MTTQHTPGPWKVLGTTTVIRDRGDVHEETICEVEDTNAFVQDEPRNAANARLIAAAPELLALARQYASECAECDGTGLRQFDHGDPCDECSDIRDVIAKASPC